MKNSIIYRLAVRKDKAEILQFLREHLFPNEPLHCSTELKRQDKYFEDYLMSCVDTENRFSLLALNGNQTVGILLCAPKGCDEEQKLLQKASQIPGSQSARILTILATLERDSNVFQKYNFKRSMHGNALAVHKDFRRNGIGLQLYDKSIQIAKALGYPLFTSDCTSIYSARLSELLGMDCINVCKMEEYRAPGSDEQVLFPDEIQKYIKTYAKIIQ